MGTNPKSIEPHNFKSTLEILEETKAVLKQIELLGNIGHWEVNLITDQCNFSEGLFKILGLDPERVVPSILLGLSIVHPEDRESATAHLQKSIETGAPYKVEKESSVPMEKSGSSSPKVQSTWMNLENLNGFLGFSKMLPTKTQGRRAQKHNYSS